MGTLIACGRDAERVTAADPVGWGLIPSVPFCPVVTPHTAVLGLTSDATQRQCAYRALIIETADSGEIEAIRLHVQRQHAYGTEGFRANIEAMLGRSAGPQKIGRPRKSAAT